MTPEQLQAIQQQQFMFQSALQAILTLLFCKDETIGVTTDDGATVQVPLIQFEKEENKAALVIPRSLINTTVKKGYDIHFENIEPSPGNLYLRIRAEPPVEKSKLFLPSNGQVQKLLKRH